jgi:crotonobetainyl-CoA:carnitine CoA-transferase CaiB-like acyl-CoA transferase
MPLSGFRVVELGTGVSSAYCGKLLAGFGAEVIKIEPPGGDPGRTEAPLIDTGEHHGESAYFAWLNVGKQSVIADPAQTRALIDGADLLLDARPPGQAASGDLAHAALRAANPSLVIVAVSWFGETGPYRDFVTTDATCRALAGLINLIGPKERPVAINDHQADIVGGLSAYIAAMTGLLTRDAGGRRFELSIHEANMALSETHTAYGPNGPRGRPGNNRFANSYPIGVFKCREGWIGAGVSSTQQWHEFCDMFGMPEMARNPKYAVGVDRAKYAEEIEPLFAPRLLQRTAAEWFAEALERKLPFAIVPEMHELLAQPVFRDDGAFATVRIGAASFEGPAIPLRLTATPPTSDGIAPLPGAAAAIAPRAAMPARAAAAARATSNGPLSNVRVVDLTMGWAGPLAARHMADLGAEVIKIEACRHPDWWRGQDPRPVFFEQKLFEKRPNFLVLNRNKTGITLDLTQPEGVALVKRLVARADAVIENYARDVLPKFGLDYPVLAQVKPDIVMVSMAAFRDGPWADARAYGFTLEQAAGLPTIAGNPDGPPLLTHYAYGDPIGGLNATTALLTALLHRQRTGQGQHIDLSQVACMFPLVAPWMIEQSVTGRVAPRLGNRHPHNVPQNCFRCRGEDAFLHIAITDDAMWRRCCAAIGRADLAADPTLATAAGRRVREDEIERVIEAWTATREADAAMEVLQARQVAAGVVRSPYDLAADPHLLARDFWQPVDRPFCGPHVQPSLAFREDDSPYPIRHPAPTLGEFNRYVLGDILGLPDSELDRLAKLGVIGTEALPKVPRKKVATA